MSIRAPLADKSYPRSWDIRYQNGCAEIELHLEGEPSRFVLDTAPHFVTTMVLWRFVYDAALEVRGRAIRGIYSDGSIPEDFDIGTLEWSPPDLAGIKPIYLGLMSARHPELDYFVDIYVNQNLDFDVDTPMADEDKLSCRNAYELLSGVGDRDGPLLIYAIHTGLEPMVVGFYRGVVQALRDRKQQGRTGQIIIQPAYFHLSSGDDDAIDLDEMRDSEAVRIGPESPGAKFTSDAYILGIPWV